MDQFQIVADDQKEDKIADDKDINKDSYNQLLQEISSLKTIVVDLHHIIQLQSETIDKVNNKIETTIDKIENVNMEIIDMKECQNNSAKFGYVKDYIIPTIGMISVNYPVYWLLGPKTGIIASTVSYMVWKIMV